MPRVGFEPTIPASKRARRVHALEYSATVTGDGMISEQKIGEDKEESGLGLILRYNPDVILVVMKKITSLRFGVG
jgi:hypothetical protein